MKKDTNSKVVAIRMPKELWAFMKNRTIKEERSLNSIINELLNKYQKNIAKKDLTSDVSEL